MTDSDAPDAKRLEHLDEAIAEVKEELHDLEGTEDEHRFVDDGSKSPDSEVDNTIAPPG
jgi:hypothetical protein